MCRKNLVSWLTTKRWNSLSCMISNSRTGLCVSGSSIWKSSSISLPASSTAGLVRISTGNSRDSGMPATSVIPHRGHLPGLLDRTSLSIGQIHSTSGSCAAAGVVGGFATGVCCVHKKAESSRIRSINSIMLSCMSQFSIAVIPGDGVGREVIPEALRVLDRVAKLEYRNFDWGSAHYLRHGRMMPADGHEVLAKFDAILLGAIGHPDVPDHVTLNGLLLPIRRGFDQYANVRPAMLYPGVASPLANPGAIDM